MFRLKLDGSELDRFDQEELLTDQGFLDVTTGPDDAIYFNSINRVLRLLPAR